MAVGKRVGKVSLKSERKRPISSKTNLDRFMSLNVLARMRYSSWLRSSLLEVPAVLKTERMFLKPKS